MIRYPISRCDRKYDMLFDRRNSTNSRYDLADLAVIAVICIVAFLAFVH
jgi:hypothetical protein